MVSPCCPCGSSHDRCGPSRDHSGTCSVSSFEKSSRLTAVVSAIGVSIFLQNAVMLIWGPRYRAYPPWAVPNIIWQVGDIYINLMQILILAVSFVLMIALYFCQHTTVGAAIRATAIDHDAARLMGMTSTR